MICTTAVTSKDKTKHDIYNGQRNDTAHKSIYTDFIYIDIYKSLTDLISILPLPSSVVGLQRQKR